MNTSRAIYLSIFLSFSLLGQAHHFDPSLDTHRTTDTTFLPSNMESEVSLLFIGDIMGHGPQIRSAYDAPSKTYDYSPVFHNVGPLFRDVDFAIANLEVTLAGPPYQGYPQFSSPDALAVACKKEGIDVLVTANNHSCDRGKQGIVRTIEVLDSLDIPHVGTYKDSTDWAQNHLLILHKNNIRLGLLNYTYGTNGLPAPAPTKVGLMQTEAMAQELNWAKDSALDQIIVFIHWGLEYQSNPSPEQLQVAQFLFDHGADIIIGSHPHVLQRMELHQKDERDQFIVYSLGNFVSNQRKPKTDGGAMVELHLTKKDGVTRISSAGYRLTWVDKFYQQDQAKYEIRPAQLADQLYRKGVPILDETRHSALSTFLKESRALLNTQNKNVPELIIELPHESTVDLPAKLPIQPNTVPNVEKP